MSQKFFKSCMLVFVSLCYFNLAHAAQPASQTHPFAAFHLPTFSALDVNGPVKIILTGQQAKQSVIALVPAETANKQLQLSVQNQVLTINMHALQYPSPVVIKISMTQPLTQLTVRNAANVIAEHCTNPNLVVTAQDAGSVNLKNIATLRSIQTDSNSSGTIIVSGLNSKNLVIRGNGEGKMKLSGRTLHLDAQLTGSAFLDACHLLAQQGHILTHDNATAFVNVAGALYGFAYNDSNIYFYERPTKLVSDTHASGNILKLVPDRQPVISK